MRPVYLDKRPWASDGVLAILVAIAYALFLVSLSGCVEANAIDGPSPEPMPEVVVEPQKPIDQGVPELPSMTITTGGDEYSNLLRLLGPANSVRFTDAHQIQQEGVTLKIPAGLRMSYRLDQSSGTFVFEKPFPTVTAKLMGPFRVSPTIRQVVIKPDGTAVASTGFGVPHAFHWLASAGAAVSVPEKDMVTIWSYDGCTPCGVAAAELAKAKAAGELPFDFQVIKEEAQRPAWIAAMPTFTWMVGDVMYTPMKTENGKLVPRPGWLGVKDLVEQWKSSQKK